MSTKDPNDPMAPDGEVNQPSSNAAGGVSGCLTILGFLQKKLIVPETAYVYKVVIDISDNALEALS